MASADDRLVLATLTRDGRSVADWFLVGECPCFRSRYGDIGDWLTSDNRLYNAVRSYLRRVGAPEYESHAAAAQDAEPGAAADGGGTTAFPGS